MFFDISIINSMEDSNKKLNDVNHFLHLLSLEEGPKNQMGAYEMIRNSNI